jgi:hypothetical protein
MKKSLKSDPLAERPDIDFSKGVRGKYTNLLAKGTNLVILDPALLKYFPDSESVNRALRAFLSIGASVQSAVPPRRKVKRQQASFDPRVGIAAKVAPRR